MSTRVLLSGATGFIASHTIAELLAAGHEVVGTVRDPANTAATARLTRLPGAAERLTLVAADLTTPNAFAPYTADVDYVIHMASPFQLTVSDPQRDLVDPAVHGTRSMLAAAAASPRVKRVVLTSSMAAITDEPDERHVLTEDDWNEKSSLTRNPYYYSKMLAERAAWDFHRERRPAWSLVSINPFIVIGPSMVPTVSESNRLFVELLAGVHPAIMGLEWGFVDVRDVATAHVRALTSPQAEGRYLCSAETFSMRAVVELLRRRGYAHARLPKFGLDSALGNRLAWLASFSQPKGVATYLRSHLGRRIRYDNGKIRRDLGLEFRAIEASILETVADLARWGHVAAAG